MGVHGLTTYILQNSRLYLNKHELSDCCLVIDGNNLACELSKKLKGHSAFGGDYDEYYARVRNFMLALKKCKITPIILLDGGSQKEKFKTRLCRRKNTLSKIKLFCQGFSAEQCFPIFLIEVFKDAVRDTGFLCIQCDLESDGEIAAVARNLNCPVMSNDSDYFIYDVLYIPSSTVNHTPIKYSHANKYYIECLIYDVNDFSETIGIDKPLLPILALLLGNDYVEMKVFSKVFNHVKMPQAKNKSHSQRRVKGLIQWLKSEDIDSAKELIFSYLRNENVDKASKVFNKTISDYKTSTVSKAVFSELTNKFGNMDFKMSEFSLNWPDQLSELYGQAYIPGFIMNMILYQFHLTIMQVENVCDHSSHYKSLDLIRKIYAMISPYLTHKKPLAVFLIVKKQYESVKLEIDLTDTVNLEKALKEPTDVRLKLLCDIVGVPLKELEIVPSDSWGIFLLGVLYWLKEFKNSVTLVHLHALVIMTIMNQIIQTKVGYHRNSQYFTKHHEDEVAELKDAKIIVSCRSSFEEMLKNISEYECHLIQKKLVPLKKTTEAGSGHEYCISTIHLFNCFQSCLYYIMVINALLNYPLPCLRIADFYSGTLLFNLYTSIKSKASIEEFGSELFQEAPNLNEIYKYLIVSLSKYVDISGLNPKKTRRRKRSSRKRSTLSVLERIVYIEDDEDEKDGEFMPENNVYALLSKII